MISLILVRTAFELRQVAFNTEATAENRDTVHDVDMFTTMPERKIQYMSEYVICYSKRSAEVKD